MPRSTKSCSCSPATSSRRWARLTRTSWSTLPVSQRDLREDIAAYCIEEVQEDFQDTFVDTTWPACPRHPNHPLNYAEGAWCCPRDGTPAARLGELPPRTGVGR